MNERSAKSHFCIYTHSTALHIKKGTLLHKYVWLWGSKNASVDEIKSWRALHSLIWLHFRNICPKSENVRQKCIIIDYLRALIQKRMTQSYFWHQKSIPRPQISGIWYFERQNRTRTLEIMVSLIFKQIPIHFFAKLLHKLQPPGGTIFHKRDPRFFGSKSSLGPYAYFCHNFDSSCPILTFKIPNSTNLGSRS